MRHEQTTLYGVIMTLVIITIISIMLMIVAINQSAQLKDDLEASQSEAENYRLGYDALAGRLAEVESQLEVMNGGIME